jgi:RecA-family ATPase
MLDLALRMPTGLPWLGKRVEPSAVIYLAAESPNSVRLRLEAYRRHHGQTHIGAFAMVPCSLNVLDGSSDVDDLMSVIDAERARLKLPVRLLIVDTLARAMAGANENAGEDMSRLVAAGDRIREVAGPHVCWIHHSGKNEAQGARGHSSLRAAVDTEIEVSEEGSTRTLAITKQRDLASRGERLSARFVSIELGRNQWDKPITACVVEHLAPESDHIRAVKQDVENERAESVVIAGFRRMRQMGLTPSDARNAQGYLPRQMLEKGLASGFDKAALGKALDRLMTRGTFRRGPVGKYSDRHPREGLILTSEGDE